MGYDLLATKTWAIIYLLTCVIIYLLPRHGLLFTCGTQLVCKCYSGTQLVCVSVIVGLS